MFVHNNMVTATPCEPGVSRKVMAYNDQVMMCEITFEKGAKGNSVRCFYTNARGFHQEIRNNFKKRERITP